MLNLNAIVVVMGAQDPEMAAIATACAKLGIRTLQAATADGVASAPTITTLVTVATVDLLLSSGAPAPSVRCINT